MKPSILGALGLLASTSSATYTPPPTSTGCKHKTGGSLVVDRAPDFCRPYVLPKFAGHATGLTTSGQIIRYSITGESSEGAFSLVQHNGKVTGWTSARPHTHRIYHEHFYCARGRVELWAKKNETDATDEARVATVGDYGNVPPGVIHTFQPTSPDSQLSHIFHPAGFERLFQNFSLGDHESPHGSLYQLIADDPAPFGPLDPAGARRLAALDLYAAEADVYVPRRDFVNGTAGDSKHKWHDGDNVLPEVATEPYFIANNYGPKFLNSDNGYKVIQPLTTPKQATHGNFTMGTITMSAKLPSEKPSFAKLPNHLGIQMEEGQLALSIPGYKTVYLLQGDVAFVPSGINFTYTATVPFTKFLYLNGGAQGLDHQLLANSKPWDYPTYPL